VKPETVKRNVLRQKLAQMGIFSLAELARMIPCSRGAIYHSARCPRVQTRIEEILNAN